MLSYAQFTRRDRFVLAAALSFGLADILVPDIFTHLFDGVDSPSSGLQGLFNSITIILSTPCMCHFPPPPITAPELFNLTVLAAGIVSSLLNYILPHETEDAVDDDDEEFQEVEAQRRTGSSEEKVEV